MGKVLSDRILVEPVAEDLSSSFQVVNTTRQKPSMGIVKQVGKDVQEVEEGDKIQFGVNAGSTINFEGKPMLIIREPEVDFNYGR